MAAGWMRPARRAVVAAVATTAALLAGCSAAGDREPDGGDPTTLAPPTAAVREPGTGVPPGARAVYRQTLEWEECRDGLQCTTVTVPVDWSTPDGATLELAVVRRAAAGEPIGSLLMNPGGPGVSGVDYVAEAGESATTRRLREGFDLVGFDPRGVGGSEPVDCLPDPEMDEYLAFDPDPQVAGGLEEMRAVAEEFAAGCAADAGDLLGHVDTASVARDLDVLRAVLGDERLFYLGGSYGTLLGATYAELFPGRVGRMVLDGAVDPALGDTEVALGQARGMEAALGAYLEDCLGRRGCPLRGDLDDALAQVRSIVAAAEDTPLRTADPDRPLTASLALYGLIAPLYDRATWPVLDAGIEGGLAGDGTALLAFADAYADRRADGSYGSNRLEAFTAVNCLDYPVDADPAAMEAAAEALEQASPTFGAALGYGQVTCDVWPVPATRVPAPLRAAGAPPVLVVGTTGDPATPYAWAESLAAQLDAARLLTREGEGHTAYLRGSACVDDAVDGYLLDGVLPGEGATCR